MENQVEEQKNNVNAPSLRHIRCPKCGTSDFQILGKKGSMGKSVGVAVAFGAVGALVANSMSKIDNTYEPIKYKCNFCKNKFEALPLVAQPDEILAAPCKISFKRMSSFLGMAASQFVWLNGVKIGPVGNGKTIEFYTITQYNTLFVTDLFGVAFTGDYKFEAQSGGYIEVKFKHKFR